MKKLLSNLLIAFLVLSFPSTVLAGGSSVGVYETSVGDKYLIAGQSDQFLMSFTVEPWEFIEHDLSIRSIQLTCDPSRALGEIKLMQEETLIEQSSFSLNAGIPGSQTATFGINDFIIPNGQKTEFQFLVNIMENFGDYSASCGMDSIVFYNEESGTIYNTNSHDTDFDGVETLIHVENPNDTNRTNGYNLAEYNNESQELGLGTIDNLLMEFDISSLEVSGTYIEDIFVNCKNAGIIKNARLTTDSKTIPLSVAHTDDYTYSRGEHVRDRTFVFTNLDLVLTDAIHFELHGDTHDYFNYYPETVTSCSVLDARITKEPVLEFSDLDLDHLNFTAITSLFWSGDLQGYEDGTFKPDQNMTRAEFVHIVMDIDTGGMPLVRCFSDVYGDWYGKDVCYAKDNGWIEGYPDGSFKPGGYINKAEALKILLESRNISVAEAGTDPWYSPYINKGHELGLFDEATSDFSVGEEATRGDISEYLYRLDE